jgi:hypothetical protein
MTPQDAAVYVERPDIPAGMTIGEYRRSRPRRPPWWRRVAQSGRGSTSTGTDGR